VEAGKKHGETQAAEYNVKDAADVIVDN